MDNKSKPKYYNKIRALNSAFEEEIFKDETMAKEYLSEGIDNIDSYLDNALDKLKRGIGELKLKEGRLNQVKLNKLATVFIKEANAMSLVDLQAKYPALPKIAARNFDHDKLTSLEIDDLLIDSSFLTFLENHFDDSEE